MNELTDKMITNELKDAAFMQNENTLIIVLMVGFLIVLGAIFIFSKNKRQKFASLGILILFEILGFMVIGNNNFMKNAVNNGEYKRTGVVYPSTYYYTGSY